MAQQIQLSPSPSSRMSSSLLRLLSSPGCSGSDQSAVYRRELACPYRSRGPVCRGTGTAVQQEGGFFRLCKTSEGVSSAFAKLARGFLPPMQTMKGGFFRPAVFSEGGFFRRGFLPYTSALMSSILFNLKVNGAIFRLLIRF
ncbi:hypothetical protein DPMN_150533 [Dreissena polymorpha]|uniref:Uncharacterized protein n=1 Tax=Dreissena polymorpha TaxID=45954 RepID=A0A9D4J6E9_DREPO|nr:hypothetical protein DPMN_150533 [Dreissena polymorpha]